MRRRAISDPLISAAVGALATIVVDRGLTTTGVSRRDGWTRTNFRGRTVSLSGGASVALGALAGAAVRSTRWRTSALVAGGCAAIAGGYDDLIAPRIETAADKGGRGHLQALRAGRLSGGAVKVAVIGAGALVAARPVSGGGRDRLVNALLIAVSANLVNLFDLRPGRAAKLVLATGAGLTGGPAAPVTAGTLGAALAGLPADLGETRMLGDVGANTLGALLGVRLTAASPLVRGTALAVALALTAASERVSFSRVIDSTPALRRLDELGRARQ